LPDADEGMTAGATWLELSVTADAEAVEPVSAILARACGGGVAIEAPFELVDDGLAARIERDRPATVRGYVPTIDASAVRSAVEQVERDLGHLQAFELRPIGELATRVVHEEDWAAAWKSHFPVLRIGRRLVIQPSWRHHRRRARDVVIVLDPGMAFGTGLHPSTRLCLIGIEQAADGGLIGGASVLDVGCGSGILAIAAGLLGARSVLAVDTDPLAVEQTTANVARNRLDSVVAARQATLPLTGGPRFDLVVANLVAGVLVDMAAGLAAAVRPAGRLLAGGVFAGRESEVCAAFERVGLQPTGRLAEGDWLAIEAQRGDRV
jgi:ribosomal protein L11 methyltransferase